MSVQILIGHTGQRLTLEDPNVTDLDGLRNWISQQTGVQPKAQVLLRSTGKQATSQSLLTEAELFCFDPRLSQGKDSFGRATAQHGGPDEKYKPGSPPDTIGNQSDLHAWQTLFRLRNSWASALLNGCTKVAQQAERYQDEEAVIAKSLNVVVASLQQHIKGGQKKYDSVAAWADDILREQEGHVQGWEHNLDSLRSIPARAEFTRFVQASSQSSRRLSQQGNIATLQGFVDLPRTRKAAGAAKRITDNLTVRLNDMQSRLDNASRQADELRQAVGQVGKQDVSYLESESEAAQLLGEIRVAANKVSSDFDHIQSLPRQDAKSVASASKLAMLHTRNYLPNLVEFSAEMNDLVDKYRDRKQQASETALEHMQVLSRIENQLAGLYADTEGFGLAEEDQQAFVSVGVIARLPSVYGQLLVESVRRREWVAKMKRDTITLQEEVATYQEEEEKRRKKWMRSVEDVVNVESLQSSRALGIELSLQNEGGSWPMVTRQELADYLEVLVQVYGEGPVTEEMDAAIKELDKPTRKQIKHAKAFKNGSMHEAAFGDTSLLLRGDEQHRSIRDMNTRLEEELKGQKSRVRKLEDLLHRSAQSSRASGGEMFTPATFSAGTATPPSLSTPLPSGELPRSASTKHRRLSSTQAIDGQSTQKLARRIVDLEAELHTTREEVKSRKNSDVEAQKQVDEAVSTKKDLMENMEAQQREFATERRNLEAELREARERVEEVETEVERLMGSREDERGGSEQRVTMLEAEIERMKQDADRHAGRAANEQAARENLESKLAVAERARNTAEDTVQQMKIEREAARGAEAEQLERLTAAHAQLSTNDGIPIGIAAMSVALEELTRKAVAHAKDLTDAVAFAKSENAILQSTNDTQRSELQDAMQTRTKFEEEARGLESRLASEQAATTSLQQQLQDEQTQLKSLRSKFAEGETGSDALRQRVADEELKVIKLSSELAQSKSHANSLDVELTRLQKSHKMQEIDVEVMTDRLRTRGEKAKEVSQRLYAQNTRLARLLERLGLAISYQDDTMVVERASKIGASTAQADPQSSTNALTSPPETRKSSYADMPTLDTTLLHWPSALTIEEENNQYTAFLSNLSMFNLETFSEAVIKRLRDFEYTARKYSREVKDSSKRADAYKDRAQRLKTEAHGKIAVRDFKEGDLALFLPTRGQAKGAWAAFNIGCPHYFLAEREGMGLGRRDFFVGRIQKVEGRVVDLGRQPAEGESKGGSPSIAEDDNPFELSDGLTWWMVHASEERPGLTSFNSAAAPTTPGLGKSTVAAANVDAKGSIRTKPKGELSEASKHLNKSLDSRRSSTSSRKGVIATLSSGAAGTGHSPRSPSIGSNFDGPATTTLRGRSESQVSLRPPPSAPVISLPSPPPPSAPAPLRSQSPSLMQSRSRSKSPSKSIRSLQRHLDVGTPAKGSPAKSPVKSPQKGKAWESLWSAEFALESPGKKGE
ncbi:hypothetical protein B0A48_06721 [Cryoendolithus antarcticus]|uniref:Autophagy-related protein 11 n=1 Tax=Cryoendolithus antarcticus TaxID=1507870 RepID=A0A1V8T998_9PEZI|nr:hypothetical protein B0A48_06721 [Cryoendolithus antarcticus]